ncbi:methylmalonyl-CoA mutase family protein, partial [Massilia niastensis]|uniref:methylmalonyl-CoA mutase family protein n=1 Tax=Massilia niastensis TaxID=544911 RepID=UPI000368F6B9
MTDLSVLTNLTSYTPVNKVRFVTAASLFDGHDASINIMRRILMANGAEVIHLGHNRSVEEIVTAALQEDAQGIAISSYQGGHVEYFKYMIDLLKARGGPHIKVFGGGGGVIVPQEIEDLHAYGVTRIFSPEDGQRMGLVGMILAMIHACDVDLSAYAPTTLDVLAREAGPARHRPLAQLITALENGSAGPALQEALARAAAGKPVPVLGITGTGGAGKSSLTDELIRRIRLDQDDALEIAVISIDPSRRKSGGALLGDRIRMNAISPWSGRQQVFMRSLATREAGSEVSPALPGAIAACKAAGFDLVIVETSGIGQGDAAIVPLVDLSMYVMTPEFGAASQLEKIDMLDFADFVAINKFDRRGALDALRDVAKQYQRNRERWSDAVETMPVFGTQASRFNDDGVTALYHALHDALAARGMRTGPGLLAREPVRHSSGRNAIVPPARSRYLAEIADTVRGYHRNVRKQVTLARERQQLSETKRMLAAANKGADFDDLITERDHAMDGGAKKLLAMWPDMQAAYAGEDYVVKIRDKEIRTRLVQRTLSGNPIRKVALPKYEDHGEVLRFLMLENVPGSFPYTAGVFAFKREGEDPTRMFAGEGDAFRTNRRFKLVSQGMDAKRLSTAFDSVTLYGA